jgi:signal recognition particle GTPase
MSQKRRTSPALLALSLACMFVQQATAFVSQNGQSRVFGRKSISTTTTTTTTLAMVFDFFKERSKEGLNQLEKLRESAARGQLGQGLTEAASYTATTNRAFADGLAKSRNRLLQNLESLLTGVSPEDVLEELQDILLQADLGTNTAEDIVAEVKSLREDSTKMLSKEDLKSIMRGKLIEALQTEKSGSIRFSTDSSIPTVLFIMGANGMGKLAMHNLP